LLANIRQLDEEVTRASSSCGSTAHALLTVGPTALGLTQPSANDLIGPVVLFDHNVTINAPGRDWYEPGQAEVSCTQCEDNCNATYVSQLASVACWTYELGACVAEALVRWGVCMAACNLPGGGCLPNPCGSFKSCAVNDHCFSFQGGNLCCPAPAAVCNGVCCGKDRPNCSPDGSCGCTSAETACGNDCCTSDQICVSGVCCSRGQTVVNGTCCAPQNVCGGTCCDELSSGCIDPVHGSCCSFAEVMCGHTCCAIGAACIGGACCPHDQICGGICCPSGHTCTDANKQVCTACPSGQAPCLPGEGAGLCCAPTVDCCPGTCCAPGETCQAFIANGKTNFFCGVEVLK
jgi:hypothetical protein